MKNVILLNETEKLIKKMIEEQLEEEEIIHKLKSEALRLSYLLEASNIGTWEWNLKNNKIKFNHKWSEMIGYTLEELGETSLDTWIKFVHPDDLKVSNEQLKRIFNKETDYYESEARMRHKNGSFIWILDRGKIVKWDKDGNPELMVGSHIEITKLKEISHKLYKAIEESEKQKILLESYIQSINDRIMFTLDKNYNYLYFNNIHKDVMKKAYNSEINIGDNIFDCISYEKDRLRLKSIYDEVLSGNSQLKVDLYGDMESAFYESSFYPIYNKTNQIIGLTVFAKDVTEDIRKDELLKDNEENLRLYINSIHEAMYGVDLDGVCTFVNQRFLDILGYEDDRIFIGKNIHEIIHYKNEDGTFLSKEDCIVEQKSLENEQIEIGQTVVWRKDGTFVPVEFSSTPQLKNGKLVGAVVTFKDITDRLKILNALNEEKNKAKQYFEIAGVILLVLDCKGRVELINKRGCEILKGTKEEIIGRNWFDHYIPEKINNEIKNFFYMSLKNDFDGSDYTNEIIDGEGKSRLILWHNSLLYDSSKNIIGVLCSGEDITEQKRKEIEIEYLSNHDFLTNLYNRRYFVGTFKSLDKNEYYPLAIMMIDLNGLKIINDAYGHNSGDIALQKTAHILLDVCKTNDTVCRIGGDEFAIIVSNTNEEELEKYKLEIKKKADKVEVKGLKLSLALGYELKTPYSTDTLDDLLKKAENFMYRDKLTESASVRNHAIQAILKTLTEKYEEERIHSKQVSYFCKKMGVALNLKADEIKALSLAGMYHDIGKISIPDAILYKPGKLDEEEFKVIKTHPEISYQILRAADEYSDLAIHTLYHHERIDGKGYPSGLKGNEIPFFSRIICIVDAFEAMTSIRPYKDKMSEEEAIQELIRCKNTQFDAKLTDIFIEKVLGKKI